MSEQALVDTIRIELRQRKASGAEYVLLTPGNYGLDYIQEGIGINPELAIPISNFIGDALDLCKEFGFRGALLVGHIGKLVKVAGGILNTHSKFGDCRMEIMAAHAGAAGLRSAQIQEMLECVTCDDALRVLTENGLCRETLKRISDRISYILDHRVDGEIKTAAIMFSKQYGFLSETENARSLLKLISEE